MSRRCSSSSVRKLRSGRRLVTASIVFSGSPVKLAMSARDAGPKAERYRRIKSSCPWAAVELLGPTHVSARP